MDTIFVQQMIHSMAGAWPGWQPDRRHWAEALISLDRATAQATCKWVIRHCRKAPSIAEWLEAYSAQRGRMVDEAPGCGRCSGTGWVTDTDHPAHWPGDVDDAPTHPVTSECMCNVARPCSCTIGTGTTSDIHRRIIRDRERQHSQTAHLREDSVSMPKGMRRG